MPQESALGSAVNPANHHSNQTVNDIPLLFLPIWTPRDVADETFQSCVVVFPDVPKNWARDFVSAARSKRSSVHREGPIEVGIQADIVCLTSTVWVAISTHWSATLPFFKRVSKPLGNLMEVSYDLVGYPQIIQVIRP